MNNYHYYQAGRNSAAAFSYSPKLLWMPQVLGQEKNGLLLQAITLSSLECNYLFGGYLPRRKGYEVVQVALTNKTDHVYQLDAKNIKLSIAPTQEVARKMGGNVVRSLFVWLFLMSMFLIFMLAFGWGIAIIAAFFLAGGVVDILVKLHLNKKIGRDFEERAIRNDSEILIYPKKIMNRVMFVKKEDYKTSFNIDLIDQKTGEVVSFPVDLR
jgi:hypothetical protein